MALARWLVKAWQAAPGYAGYEQPARPDKRDTMLRLLRRLGDAALLEEFIKEVVTRDYDGRDNAALVAGARLLGAKYTGRLLSELVREHLPHRPGPCVDLLDALARISFNYPHTDGGRKRAARTNAIHGPEVDALRHGHGAIHRIVDRTRFEPHDGSHQPWLAEPS